MDGDDLAVGFGRALAVVRHEDAPAVSGWFACRRDVAAEADQDTRSARLVGGAGGEVGSQGLATRAEVQLHAGQGPDRSSGRIEEHGLPAGNGLEMKLERLAAGHDPAEVVVITDESHRPPDRRIHEPIAQSGGADRGADRSREERADRHVGAGSRVEKRQLAVRPKAAVRPVDAVEHRGHGVAGRCGVVAGDEDADGRPECSPGGLGNDT